MYKKVSITIIMASAIATILIVPWAALQRSYAQSDLANTILKIHNDERTAVGSPALKWSDSLAADAKSWAEHLVKLNEGKLLEERTQSDLVHSTGTGQGENLAYRWWTGGGSGPSTDQLIQGWVNEKPYRGSFDHYTQMVWKTTEQVGCATATASGSVSAKYGGGPGQGIYTVCRYSPPGNMAGETPF